MNTHPETAIIGGGIVGLSCAYYLQKRGHAVVVVNANDHPSCSTENAGMVVPSHFMPLASPGMAARGMRWAMQSKSPFYIEIRPSYNLLRWLYLFYRSARSRHIKQAIQALVEITTLSQDLYATWNTEMPFSFAHQHKGLLMMYQSKTTEQEKRAYAHHARQLGLEAQVLTPTQVQDLEPELEVRTRGAVYFPRDSHLIPQKLIEGLVTLLKQKGVRFTHLGKATHFYTDHHRVQHIVCEQEDFPVSEVIIAAGVGSSELVKKLGRRLPLQAGKGYSMTLTRKEKNLQIPSILTEERVAMTPMGETLRLAGTLEITKTSNTIRNKKIESIIEAVPRYYPEITPERPKRADIWYGFRPCSPDGLPYIGRIKGWKNVTLATGHGTLGMTLGPATGLLVAQIMDEQHPEIDLKAFDPTRF